jgi:hypothetical protein
MFWLGFACAILLANILVLAFLKGSTEGEAMEDVVIAMDRVSERWWRELDHREALAS